MKVRRPDPASLAVNAGSTENGAGNRAVLLLTPHLPSASRRRQQ